MANPITWRNIEGPDPVRALVPFSMAASTINDAFSGLKNTFDEYQTGVKNRNTEAFLDALSQFRTAEDLEAAMQSGLIDRLRQQHGNLINPEAREAADKRLGLMLDRAFKKEDQEFQRNTDIRAGEAHGVNMEYGRMRNKQLEGTIGEEEEQKAIDAEVAKTFSALGRGHQADASFVTEQVGRLYDSLSERFNPAKVQESIKRHEDMLLFGSEGFGPDKLDRALQEAADKQFMEYLAEQPKRFQQDLKEMSDFLTQMDPDADSRDLELARPKLGRFLATEYSLASGVKVRPPVWAVQEAILEAGPGRWTDAAWGESIERILARKMKEPRVLRAMEDQVRVDAYKAGIRLRDELNKPRQ